jgi:octaprenyl-diphosphate synthase
MVSLSELYAPITARLDDVRRLFEDELATESPFVRSLCERVERYRGKMLRPALVLLAGEACGATTREHVVLGTVVEMVHMATLVHDDVLDEADMRRGAPSINRLHGNEAAVMLGDLLISHAFHLCSSLDSQYASRLIGSTTNTVCEGELMQLHQRGNASLSQDEYFAIISRKTASLMSTCCVLGARCAGASPTMIARLENYGLDVGIAFQIVDDVLDIQGDEARMGKTLGRDLDKAKLTLPVIHFLRHAPAAERARAREVLSNGNPRRAQVLRELLDGSDSVAFALDVARQYVRSALANVRVLPESGARRSLETIASYIARRQR